MNSRLPIVFANILITGSLLVLSICTVALLERLAFVELFIAPVTSLMTGSPSLCAAP